MDNCFTKQQKQPRTIIMANNKKQKEIDSVLIVKNEMLKNDIDEKLIKEYVDEQYKNINLNYEIKVKKYWDKQNKTPITNKKKSNKKNKEIELSVLMQNKNFLEESGYTQEYIDKYIDNYYQKINNKYNQKNKESTFVKPIIDFIN